MVAVARAGPGSLLRLIYSALPINTSTTTNVDEIKSVSLVGLKSYYPYLPRLRFSWRANKSSRLISSNGPAVRAHCQESNPYMLSIKKNARNQSKPKHTAGQSTSRLIRGNHEPEKKRKREERAWITLVNHLRTRSCRRAGPWSNRCRTPSASSSSPSPKVPKSQVTRTPHAADDKGLLYIDGGWKRKDVVHGWMQSTMDVSHEFSRGSLTWRLYLVGQNDYM
jgi:hypothetical protein